MLTKLPPAPSYFSGTERALRSNFIERLMGRSWPTVTIAASVAMILPLVAMRWIPVLDDLADLVLVLREVLPPTARHRNVLDATSP
ncbi:MAG: hypothetical protein E6H52_04220 [Betaproteobacteria bacterium]|nr:MAG: hypothetical protein E6H52_04220 [Betaproteobacteria bacterium]